MKPYFTCLKTKNVLPFGPDVVSCPYCNPYYNDLIVEYEYNKIKLNPVPQSSSWQNYQQLLPNKTVKIDFDEQKTPLIKVDRLGKKYGFSNLYIKDESKNPTGSFKDRGNFCLINCLSEWGIKNIIDASSGNDAVSTAAYSQKAGIKCHCLVPEHQNGGKTYLIQAFGGLLKKIGESYEDTFRHALDTYPQYYNVTSGFNPIKDEGYKLIAFEIWEDIGSPDVIMAPCGNGSLLFALYKAYFELQKIGLVTKIPKFYGIQIQGASPLGLALQNNTEFEVIDNPSDSIAEGIVAKESFASPKTLYAIKNSHGKIIQVTDQEIEEGIRNIVKEESLIPEPTSASVVAALEKTKEIKNEKVVLILTAGGLKNLEQIVAILKK